MRGLLLFLISVTPFMAPDPSVNGVKIVTRQVTGGFSDTRTEYLTADRLRSEWQSHLLDGRTGPPMATIVQRGTNHVFLLDLQAREYIAFETDSQGVTLGVKRDPVHYSAGTLQIWIQSTDTGERQEMFGHVARHIITREKRIATPGACSRSSESETDGWYIDETVMPEWRRTKKPGNGVVVATVMAVNASSSCIGTVDHIDVHRSGVNPGFPLKMTTTMKSEVPEPDGGTRMVASSWGSEVMELKEGALDGNLFDVPGDFHRVDALKNWYVTPPPRRQLTGWEWFKEKLAQLFQ